MKLDAWLKTDHSQADRLKLVAALLAALDEAHKRGITRGGLEPSGIEVTSDGGCRLDADPPRPGSPYLAPELAQGGRPTAKAEIYSVGCICYEVLAGKPAFEADPPRPLQDVRPDLPHDLTDAVSACMERDTEWRPADLSYLLALLQSLHQEAKAAPPPPSRRVGVAAPPRSIPEATPRKRHDDRSALTRALPLILVVVAIAGAGGAWLWFDVLRPRGASPPAEPRGSGSAPATPAPPASRPQAAGPPSPAPAVARPPATTTPSRTGLASSVPTPAPRNPALRPTPAAAPAEPAAAPAPEPPAATPQAPVPAPATPAAATPEPVPAGGQATSQPPDSGALAGPASVRAVAPFELRAGAMHVLDVHGANLRPDHRAKIVPLRRRELGAGFTITRYQLRSPALLLVFLQIDPAVPPGKYALSLVDAQGQETNSFTIEVSHP